MKYQHGKIKREHGILREFTGFLNRLEKIPQVKRIIPGRISRTQQGNSHQTVTFSYTTHSGLKCNIKKWGTAQELFITCRRDDAEPVIKFIEQESH